jgi:formylglycine-generating enzyme required for sulfatase activity
MPVQNRMNLPPTITDLPFPDLDLVPVPGGSFMMGIDKAADPDAYGDDGPPHRVSLQPFYLGKYPVTQRLWAAVMGADDNGAQPSRFQGLLRPKTNVSWDEARAFAQALNDHPGLKKQLGQFGLEGWHFHLPSEAQWEYASKGGNAFPETGPVTSKNFKYCGSNKLKEVGWYDDNSHGETKPVGLKFPNELGLYDMSGNVWEWCEDDWHDNYDKAPDDGRPWVDSPERGGYRVCRGGSCFHDARLCRSSCRSDASPGDRDSFLGFRLALSPQFRP